MFNAVCEKQNVVGKKQSVEGKNRV